MEVIDDLLRAADESLYAAKHAGRNCVRTAGGSPVRSPSVATSAEVPNACASASPGEARTQETLLEFAGLQSDASDLNTILYRTARTAAVLTRCRRIAILLDDESRGLLRVAHAFGLNAAAMRQASISTADELVGRVYRTREHLLIESDGRAPVAEAPSNALLGRPPCLVAPLVHDAASIGVLVVADRAGREPFGPLELGGLNVVCRVAAAAIHAWRASPRAADAGDAIIAAIGKLAECRDHGTSEHIGHVTTYCLLLADTLRRRKVFGNEIDDDYRAAMRKAAPLHDLGKIGVPDSILLKPGRLSPPEVEIMHRHCQIGADCIRSVLGRTSDAGFLRMALDITSAHHEWYDGTGYPIGLAGDAIPLAARIVALADVYDALRMERPYKPAMPHREAREIIVSSSGRQFDPRIVAAFEEREDDFIRAAEPRLRRPAAAKSVPAAGFSARHAAARSH
jgi:HD-GYP domain-containing protein (c-di-GMP phosphodiesterase class II)